MDAFFLLIIMPIWNNHYSNNVYLMRKIYKNIINFLSVKLKSPFADI